MGLLVYKFSDYEHTAEREQYRALCKQLKAYYENREEICLFVANYNIYDCELDGILIKQDAIMSVEFKNYGGVVNAVENGNWKLSDGTIIKGGSRKSVYQQARLNHVAIKQGFKDGGILPSNMLKDVASLVVFHQPIELNNQLSAKTKSWLHISDEQTFMEKVQDITSPNTFLTKKDMVALVSKMALDEEYLDENYSNMEIIHSDIQTEFTTLPVENENNLDEEPDIKTNIQMLDDEEVELFNFVSHILNSLFKDKHFKVNVSNSTDVCSLFKSYGITLSKKYIITVESDGIGIYCNKISRFINHPVRAINNNLIFWEEGMELSEQIENNMNLSDSQTINNTSNSNSHISFRKSKTILPHWIDKYIFNTLSAQYAPEHLRFEYNLDLNEDEIRVYLGTYFPRSYAEAFCIYDNLLRNDKFKQELEIVDSINILDVGCGTGGELLGVLTALSKHVETSQTINIIACDGNDIALSVLNDICKIAQANTHHTINFSAFKKTFSLKTKLDTKDYDNKLYDIILCNKVVCELISHNVMNEKAYYKTVKSLAPSLNDNGVFILLDMTTKDEHSGLFYPQLMNTDINNFVTENPCFETLLPLSCGKFGMCKEACFMQQTFYVSHSHKTNDESRVCYRVLCKKTLKDKLSLPKAEDACFVIHPIKYKQGDASSTCKHSKGNNIIDSFNINN